MGTEFKKQWLYVYLIHNIVIAKVCPTLCDPVDCSPPGSSVRGLLQARRQEWVALPSSRGSSWSRDRTCVSWVAGRQVPYHWATWEASVNQLYSNKNELKKKKKKSMDHIMPFPSQNSWFPTKIGTHSSPVLRLPRPWWTGLCLPLPRGFLQLSASVATFLPHRPSCSSSRIRGRASSRLLTLAVPVTWNALSGTQAFLPTPSCFPLRCDLFRRSSSAILFSMMLACLFPQLNCLILEYCPQ